MFIISVTRTARTENSDFIAQLGERKTEDLEAPCSIHGQGTFVLGEGRKDPVLFSSAHPLTMLDPRAKRVHIGTELLWSDCGLTVD